MASKKEKTSNADRIKKRYPARSFSRWLTEKHPDTAADLERSRVDISAPAGTGRAAGPMNQDTRNQLINVIGKKSTDALEQAYKRDEERRSEDLAEAMQEAAENDQIDPAEVDNVTVTNQKAYDRATARVAKKYDDRKGRSVSGTSGGYPGGVGPGGLTGGSGPINEGNMREYMSVPEQLASLMQEHDMARNFTMSEEEKAAAGPSFLEQGRVQVAGTGGYDTNRVLQQNRVRRLPGSPGAARQRGEFAGAYGGGAAYRGPTRHAERFAERMRREVGGAGVPGAMSPAKAATLLNSMSPEQVTRMQQHLALTGFFDETDLTENKIVWGFAGDTNTVRAWANVINQAWAQNKSITDVIHELQVGFAPRANALLAGLSGASGEKVEVTLSDPDTIRSGADEAFVRLLGRLPTEAERNVLIGSIRGAQMRVGQEKLAAARGVDHRPKDKDGNPIAAGPGNRGEIDALVGGPMAEVVNATGGLVMPVPGGRYSNDFGQARSGGRGHQGTDIFAPTGTPIYAAKAGIVRRTRTSSQGGGGVQGRMGDVSITGNDGVNYYYNHMANHFAVAPGQQVKAGQLIGYVGDGGNIGTPSHLHFSMNEGRDGLTKNPYPFLRGAQNLSAGGVPPMPFGPGTMGATEAAMAEQASLETYDDVDVSASIEEAAKRDNPVEYGAQRIGNAYQDFVKSLRGEV